MIEAGQIGRYCFLMADALDLRACIVGAFQDQASGRALHLSPSQCGFADRARRVCALKRFAVFKYEFKLGGADDN